MRATTADSMARSRLLTSRSSSPGREQTSVAWPALRQRSQRTALGALPVTNALAGGFGLTAVGFIVYRPGGSLELPTGAKDQDHVAHEFGNTGGVLRDHHSNIHGEALQPYVDVLGAPLGPSSSGGFGSLFRSDQEFGQELMHLELPPEDPGS